ncbi:phosphotransferase [Mycoplasmopsis caviae]|uniref:Phosphotransferase n=1 Tax=Mycoplasmopsis caviae TaxID=55603 RepID=A0A3P8MDA5_9BACT|nr:phosphotransferase [Mycoplasmopsis caviae]UUD35674.1 phosphotransferase [Mycoplasmopsis caviae]VDR41580.1 thiamine kinase [Mycoplasmopsis caviae]
MKVLIKKGHTNISYRDNELFIQQKVVNKFNHKLDYSLLSNFDFVPKLIKNENDEVWWEFIDGKEYWNDENNIIQVANNLKILHSSKLKFPASNHAARIKEYRKILQEKKIKLKVLDDFYRPINMTLSRMRKDTPLHNDLWFFNMIVKNKKVYFIDWEYSSLGDKHFELAYYIEANELSNEQEKLFLETYGNYDYIYLLRHKILVNYIVILWAYSQDVLPFSTNKYEERIYHLNNELKSLTID